MSDKLPVELGEIQQSMLVAVYLRAQETRRPDGLVRDQKALEIVDKVQFDFAGLKTPVSIQLDAALRAELLDEKVGKFINEHPDGIIVNIGSGLDGRFWRLDNGRIRWFDVDMPDSLIVRRQFYEEGPRNKFIASSMFDSGWIDQVGRKDHEPLLIIAEGVLVFFPEDQLRGLFRMLAERLPGADMFFWSVGPGSRKQIRKRGVTVGMLPEFRWETQTGAEVTKWDDRIRFVAEWPFIDRHPERWPMHRLMVSFPKLYFKLKGMLKITHVRFARPGEPPAAPLPADLFEFPKQPFSLLKLIDDFGFLIGFATSMISAGQGAAWIGILAVIGVVAVRLKRDHNPVGVLKVILAVTVLGVLLEQWLHGQGIVQYHAAEILIGTCPLWAVFLWINFSAKLSNLSAELLRRYFLSAILGGLLTAVAYSLGQRVGALDLGPDTGSAQQTLFFVGCLLFPVCVWITRKLHGGTKPATM